jgi:hypothetical protein
MYFQGGSMGKMKALGWILMGEDSGPLWHELYDTAEEANKSGLEYSKEPYKATKVYIKQKSEWIDWAGGDCPVEDGVRIKVRFRDGIVARTDNPATGVRWSNTGLRGDVVAYKLKAK